MNAEIAILLVIGLLFVEGRDDFDERKKFHEWLCKKRPSLKGCSKPFTMSSFEKELRDHREKGASSLQKAPARAFAAKTHAKKSFSWDDFDTDEDYEYYLWKKYGKGKFGKTIQDDNLSSGPSVQYRKNSDTYSSYYSSPSYSYGYPAYSYSSSYPYYSSGYGYGYPSTGSYGYGIPWLGNGLFSLGFGRGLDIMTPIGGFGIGSGFSIGIG
nr:unnamed protein product [Haemonchus contortus]